MVGCKQMKNEPFFTIIIVSFNSGAKLRNTLRGVLDQTFRDFEVIIKDAVSSDMSMSDLPADPRISIISSKDRGIYDGMNIAVRNAVGRYVIFLNCGDGFEGAGVLENVQREILSGESAGQNEGYEGPYIFYGDILERITGQVVKANPVMDDFACYRNLPCHQACFYSRELFEKRGFDLDLKVRADYEHFLYCKYRLGARPVYLGFTVADYEGGGFSETEENRRISAKEHRLVTELYLPLRSRICFESYMILTLQPLREKLSHGKHTAAIYDRIKNSIYNRKK